MSNVFRTIGAAAVGCGVAFICINNDVGLGCGLIAGGLYLLTSKGE